LLNRRLPLPRPLEAGSPLAGSDVEMLTWKDATALLEQTKRAMTRALGLRFRRGMIATITFRGREHSLFTPYDRLGAHRLKAYTGGYDLLGNPVYSYGDFLIDSVYRFKGQAAPCVIFTEIDFEALDELTVRKLFVGVTRASMKLILVMSRAAAKKLVGGGGKVADGNPRSRGETGAVAAAATHPLCLLSVLAACVAPRQCIRGEPPAHLRTCR
jgi:hypothetical protein